VKRTTSRIAPVPALLLLAVTIAPADSTPTSGMPLAPTSNFRLEVDGREIREAEMYVCETGLVILNCPLKDPILVARQDQTVRYLPAGGVVRDSMGNYSLTAVPSSPISTYQVSSGHIIFQAEGRRLRLSPREPLVGEQTLEAIIRHAPDYARRIEDYRPDAASVEFLKKYARKTQLDIYFGTWCSVCEAWIPRLVKSIQASGNAAITTRFLALDKNFPSDPKIRAKDIRGVPTIILIQDGREVGRLAGRPEGGTIEESLVRLLRTAGS
jgi:thiol-disulfide isomerase/thioredoxin